jgi:hypothetical protein
MATMGYISDSLQLFFAPKIARSLWGFNSDLQRAESNMVVASRLFFDRIGYSVIVERDWDSMQGRILVVSSHTSTLDGFALAMACPKELPVRRVMSRLTAQVLGPEVVRGCITVWPRGNYRNLICETRGFTNRIAYLLTHRWGPWVSPHLALNRMVAALERGECLTMLPSGVIGERRWRAGIGGILLEAARLQLMKSQPMYLAPVYLSWNHIDREVLIRATGLYSFEQLLSEANLSGAVDLSAWLEKKYETQTWN